ncbi:hypothetical protein AMC82_PD00955 (plasmid) [Rhizobium phaseoli]|uniref:hypothetical protein n=1 Tax=Rhizobium phaseoli TaxID=396 RepID=UPI0007EA6427|nr:hypothetical protein [Rhizobium phaseoli]ANL38299.1 hypothetical protein AMC89_PD00841 [Rhizobium phaseoli]ANL69917.1 hypothetical protein AMC84_PD00959 [Rhizobium phaseoli]ANL76354.1 hypothetical protein AMC83_PE00946 [Rhizobium phaseoli]ANL82709.1 hypothetical protein AMC82_PD00955 [Rhizobium phaseoli]ANM02003.1 hypothetical protein AMC79_PD00838 [Rhizobium phaseoli]
MKTHGKTSGFALRIFCAMLLVLLGFAHRPVVAAPVADLAMYVLPDGSIPSLCQSDHDGKPTKHVDRDCEACRIASSIVIPLPPGTAEVIVRKLETVTFAFAAERFHHLNFPPNAPPRGPPALPVSSITV